jgi:hypothetical protein
MPLIGSGDLGQASCPQDVAIQVYWCKMAKAHNPWTCSVIFATPAPNIQQISASENDAIQEREWNTERPAEVDFMETNCGERLERV